MRLTKEHNLKELAKFVLVIPSVASIIEGKCMILDFVSYYDTLPLKADFDALIRDSTDTLYDLTPETIARYRNEAYTMSYKAWREGEPPWNGDRLK